MSGDPFHVTFTEPLSAVKHTLGAIAHQALPVYIIICILQVLVVPLLAGATGKADVKPLTYVSALMALAGVGLLVEKGGVIMPNSGGHLELRKRGVLRNSGAHIWRLVCKQTWST